MSTIVQRIDFVLSLGQILEMSTQEARTNGIKLTFGITDQAEMMFTAQGVFWDGARMVDTSDPTKPCPIPPDCPHNLECVQKLNQLMPVSANAAAFFNPEVTN